VGRMKVWTDGGSRGNPGPSAWAFVTDSGHSEGGFLGLMGTNNEAEYTAMLKALEFLSRIVTQEWESYQVYTDSRLLEGQLMCGWKCKAGNLQSFVKKCKRYLQLTGAHIYYVPREQNKEADRLVNEVLDAQENGK
jgi:ribonuclease HI